MYQQLSPNMLKTFNECPRKFDFKYLQDIQMPVNDNIFEFGKNIHAIASYYLRKENIDKIEKSLSPKEAEVWNYLKSCAYFSYEVIGTEYSLSVRTGKHFFGGRIDALVKNGNKYYILDYKTGSAPKNAKYDFQTIIYILSVKEFFKTNDITFVYLDLNHKTETVIHYTQDLDDKYTNILIDIAKKIDNYEKFPKKQDCKCEYSPICF